MTESDDRRTRAIEELILGSADRLTRDDVVGSVGLTVQQGRPYWRALGFPDVGSDAVFTQTDIDCLKLLLGWVQTGLMDEQTAMEVVRGMGQTASRLADWQIDSIMRVIAEPDRPVDLELVADVIGTLLPGLERLLVHTWRRHLAAGLIRSLAGLEGPDVGEAMVGTVGFADIAGFTRLVRAMGDADISQLVHAFETGAADVVAGQGGRLVKTLGDEVMFVTDDADRAAAIAIALHQLKAPGPEPLTVRIGMATGGLVSRMGDLFGGTVNRASRLAAIARPGWTFIDPATEEALADPSVYAVRHLAPRRLRGMGLVRVSSLAARRS